jgi:predicted Zn-dependent peptidase
MNAPRLCLVLAALALPGGVAAQVIDRSAPPAVGAPPRLNLPAIQSTTLGNGLRIYLVEMHEVPLVQVNLQVEGGGRSDAALAGLAAFTANMMDEGAAGRDAFQIAGEADYLGAQLSTGANWDGIVVTLRVAKRNLDPALGLMSDVALRPTFAPAEVERQRELRLAEITQSRDDPDVVGALTFNAVVYPAGHPYHRPLDGDSASTAALDSAVVRQFYDRMFQPSRARILITGDMTLAEAREQVGRAFGSWLPAPGTNAGRLPQAPGLVPHPTAIYLVDKPDAAQSVLIIGGPGMARLSPDYYAVEVMNTILGGSFSSRLNDNLREKHGYVYHARSAMVFRPLPGPFMALADVRTDVTDSSLVQIFWEFGRIRDTLVTPVELTRAKNYIALGLPREFETTRDMSRRTGEMLDYGLPPDYYSGYVDQIMSVTAADVQRVARKYLRPDQMYVIVVGDLAKIRTDIDALKLGPSAVWNPEGMNISP